MPYSQDELVFKLRPSAHSLGMTMQSIGEQLRAAITGSLVQVFYQDNEEIEVRIR